MSWQIDLSPPDEVVRAYLQQHRIWGAYALADLRPPFRERSTYTLAREGEEVAVVLVYRTSTFTALIPFGMPEGVAALLTAMDPLPENCIVSNLTGDLRPLIDGWYTLRNEELMYRMAVTQNTFKPFEGLTHCERLSLKDVPEMSGFYSMNNVPTFSPDQVQHGIYYGIRRHGLLVAVGGTHFIDREDRVAAIGNVYTDQVLRGNGYARTIVSVLVAELFEQGCSEVVLNVEKSNFRALQLYEALGFISHALFYEGLAHRKSS